MVYLTSKLMIIFMSVLGLLFSSSSQFTAAFVILIFLLVIMQILSIFKLAIFAKLDINFLAFKKIDIEELELSLCYFVQSSQNIFERIQNNIKGQIEDTNELVRGYINKEKEKNIAEDFYVKLIQSLHQGVGEIDFENNYMYISEKMKQILELEKDCNSLYCVVGDMKFKTFVMDNRWQRIDDSFNNNYVYNFQNSYIYDLHVDFYHYEYPIYINSKEKWVSVHISESKDTDKTHRRIYSIEDITEKKLLQEKDKEQRKKLEINEKNLKRQKLELQKSEGFLKKAQQIGKIGTFEINLKKNFIHLSSISRNIIGSPSDIISSEYFKDPEVGRELRNNVIERLVSKEVDTIENYELRIFNIKENIHKWVLLNAQLEENENLDPLIVGVLLENTERKNKEKELENAKKKAENSEKVKTRFFANMAHEIRTPLNSILTFSNILIEQLESKKHKSYFKIIYDNSQVMLELISGILDLTKMEEGKMSLSTSTAHARSFFEESLNLFSLRVKEKNLDLYLRIDPRIPKDIFIDRMKFKQVISNMVSNSIKFTDSGAIVLSVVFERYTNSDSFSMRLNFFDTGKGIVKKNQSTIFEPYRQQESQDMNKYQGTGLGLALIKNIAEIHNGRVEILSSYQIGTTFSVFLKGIKYIKEERKPREDEPDYNLYSIFNKKEIIEKVENMLNKKTVDMSNLDLKHLGEILKKGINKNNIIMISFDYNYNFEILEKLKKTVMLFISFVKRFGMTNYPSLVFFINNKLDYELIKDHFQNGFMFFSYVINKNHFSKEYILDIINNTDKAITKKISLDNEIFEENGQDLMVKNILENIRRPVLNIINSDKKDEKEKNIEDVLSYLNSLNQVSFSDFIRDNEDEIDDIISQMETIKDVKSNKFLKKLMKLIEELEADNVGEIVELKENLSLSISVFDIDKIDEIIDKFMKLVEANR